MCETLKPGGEFGLKVNAMQRRVPHGVAGLLVVLFALAGLAFSYGLGHPPPYKLCVAHHIEAPASADSAGLVQAQSPLELPHSAPQDACLSLAVLLTLVILGLAAVPRRWAVRPRRFGWTLSPPAAWSPLPRSLAALQVLRL